jgi:hypothetical protein
LKRVAKVQSLLSLKHTLLMCYLRNILMTNSPLCIICYFGFYRSFYLSVIFYGLNMICLVVCVCVWVHV